MHGEVSVFSSHGSFGNLLGCWCAPGYFVKNVPKRVDLVLDGCNTKLTQRCHLGALWSMGA